MRFIRFYDKIYTSSREEHNKQKEVKTMKYAVHYRKPEEIRFSLWGVYESEEEAKWAVVNATAEGFYASYRLESGWM